MTELEAKKAIEAAITNGDVQTVLRLIHEDKSRLSMQTVFGSWLHIAAEHGQLEILKRLLDLGLDINALGGIAGGTALQVAASEGQVEAVKFLISQGALLDTSAPEKNPLFGAIHNGHTEVARMLIDAGIETKVKYKGESGKTKDALSFACEWGRKDIAKLIEAANPGGAEHSYEEHQARIARQREADRAKIGQLIDSRPFQSVLLETAIREGLVAFRKAIELFPQERFYAFCFYADGDLSGVYPHANTVESLMRIDSSRDPNYFKWAPAEWKLNFGQYGDPGFMNDTNLLLGRRAFPDDEFGEYKRQTMATLAQALIIIRNSSIFSGHADVNRLAFWVNIGDACGEEEWMFEPVIDHMPSDIVEDLRKLFEFHALRKDDCVR